MGAPHFPAEFFELNYRFALRIAEISGAPLPDVLLRHTHLYLAFGLGRSFDPADPRWAAFLKGLAAVPDALGWIVETYHALTGGVQPYTPEHPYGVFAYSLWEAGRVRLHFFGGPVGVSSLSRRAVPQREAELAALVAAVRRDVPEARSMVGGSWLYNIEAYRRLFPQEYLATAAPEDPETQFIALWGQFLDYRRRVKPEVAARFLSAVEAAPDLTALLHAFPYPVLRLECPIAVFYEHYLS